MRGRPLPVSVFLVLLPALLAAQAPARNGGEQPRRVLAAVRVSGPAPAIDGIPDEPVWLTAPAATDFVQYGPTPGAPASMRTDARVLYDDAAIYVAMWCFDPAPDSIAATLGRRDFSGYSDFAHVIIDSYHDRRTAFRFSVNPAGVMKDVFHSEDFNEDLGWDAVWEARTHIDSTGWTVEWRIPFSQLRYAGGPGEQVWGINFLRHIARRAERAFWAPILPDVQGMISRAGDLTGLSDLPAVRRIELQPYAVGRLTRAPGVPSDPFYSRNAWFGSGGADLKAGVTSNLTLNATINPDFGQVEADPSVVNLSAFETFFEERRPFFVEGSDIFRFDLRYPYFIRGTHFRSDAPFYTRRVGRAPQGSLPGDAVFADMPQAANILAAAKLSGKTAGGWSIGVLDAVTGRETARFLDAASASRETIVEPLSNYGVARVIRDFRGGQSAVGGIFTATHRDLGETTRGFLRSSAYLGGVDLRHRYAGGNRELRASVAASHIRGSAEAISAVQLGRGHFFQRPDAPHLRYDSAATSMSGFAVNLLYEKGGGGRWRYGLYGHARSPGFEMNDVGFQRTTDWALEGAWLGYHVNDPGSWYRRWNVNLNQWGGVSFGGERQALGFNTNGGVQFRNFWVVQFSIDHELPALSPSDLRGGPALYKPTATSYSLSLGTDDRRPVSFQVQNSYAREYQSGGWSYDLSPAVFVRPSSRMDLTMAPYIGLNRDRSQFVAVGGAADGPHYVFARIAQTTAALTVRFNYTFTHNISLQLYAQPFIGAGRYSEFKEVSEPRAGDYGTRFHTYAPAQLAYCDQAGAYAVFAAGGADCRWTDPADTAAAAPDFVFGLPDFNIQEMRSNVVLRWEYRPGSSIFVVWSSGRSGFVPDGSFDFSRDVRRLFDAPATNVLLVKVSYWLNL